jgi:hypothetical protein
MKPEDAPDRIGKTLASQNDLLVTEQGARRRQRSVLRAEDIDGLKAELERLQELLEKG